MGKLILILNFNMRDDETLLLVDTSIFLHRAFDGKDNIDPVGKFYKNLDLLLAIVNCKVDRLIWCLDGDMPTFRHKRYPLYKAQRPEKTQEFRDFKDFIHNELKKKYLTAYNPYYEADDLLYTLAKTHIGKVVIATADLDQSQTVGDNIVMLKPCSLGVYEKVDTSYIINRYGIYPWQIPHLKALMGDTSDNLKLGIKGFGQKKASSLLLLYDTADKVLEAAENDPEFPFPKLIPDLLEKRDKILLFLEMTTLSEVKCIQHLLQ
jgi:DNA polymerase-1